MVDDTGFSDGEYEEICDANRRAVPEIDADVEFNAAQSVLAFLDESVHEQALDLIARAVKDGWRHIGLYQEDGSETDSSVRSCNVSDLCGIDPATGQAASLPSYVRS